MSTTPAYFDQIVKLKKQLGDPDSDRMQCIIESGGDLLRVIGDNAHLLSRVDRDAYLALFKGLVPTPTINWRPVTEYAEKYAEWNQYFGWGLSSPQLNSIVDLPDHAGPLAPTSVSLTFNKGLLHDRAVVQQVIAYEMAKAGKQYTDYPTKHGWAVAYYPGSEPAKGAGAQLNVDLLDVGKHWDPVNGTVPRKVRAQYKGQRLPGLEVDWLVALNAETFNTTSYDVLPGFIAAGLVVDSDCLPVFRRGSDESCVRDVWDGGPWYDDSVVVFREC